MLALNIILSEEIVQKAKALIQTIIYNEKLNKNYLSARVSLYENIKPRSPILFSLQLRTKYLRI